MISVGGVPSTSGTNTGEQPSIKASNSISARHSGASSSNQGTQSSHSNQGTQSSHGTHGNQGHGNQGHSNQNSWHSNQSVGQSSNHGNQSSNHGNQGTSNISAQPSSSFDGMSAYIESDEPSQDKGSLLESASRSAGLHPEVLQGSIIREDNPSFNIFRRNNNYNNYNNNNYSYSSNTNSYNQYSFTSNTDQLPSVQPLENNQELASTLYDPSSLEQSFQTDRRDTDK